MYIQIHGNYINNQEDTNLEVRAKDRLFLHYKGQSTDTVPPGHHL